MDQDKAQQSIDTLSEKVNGVVRSVRVSCSPENDYRGEKDYRSVFGVQEIECLYVDTEVLNKQFEGEPWEGKMTVRSPGERQRTVLVCERERNKSRASGCFAGV